MLVDYVGSKYIPTCLGFICPDRFCIILLKVGVFLTEHVLLYK